MEFVKKRFFRFSFQVFSFLCIVLVSGLAYAADVTFFWTPNSESFLAGYKIYYGTTSRNYTTSVDVGKPATVDGVVSATLSGFTAGVTYYFAATAYDTDGFESEYSTELVWTAPEESNALPPTANNTVLSMTEDTTGYGQLEGQSQEGLPLTYHIVANGSLGIATITDASSGTYRYIPSENVFGTDSFTYKVSDSNGESNHATVTVTINSVNDNPVSKSIQVATKTDQQLIGNMAGSDVDGDVLTYSIVRNGSLGQAEVMDSAAGVFSYTPNPGVSGTDSFTYKVNDGIADSIAATVSVIINEVNEAPVAEDGILSVNENETASGVLVGSDLESSELTYHIVNNAQLGQVTILDETTGAYEYTPLADEFGEDYFQFAVMDEDGALSNVATVAVSIAEVSANTIEIEMGEVTVNSNWSWVAFSEPFAEPVVVAKPAGNNDENPCVVRIRNLTSNGFEIRLQNWNYLPDNHADEIVSFVALERGTHVMEDGTMIEAGVIETDKVNSFVQVDLAEPFNTKPVVVASIVTYNGGDAVDGRIRNVSTTGFEYTMQEQESKSNFHVVESISYVAWEPSSGLAGDMAYEIRATGNEVKHNWYTLPFSGSFAAAPVFVADMQTRNGGDTANLRYADLNAESVQIKVAEEESRDSETNHITEIVGFMAFSQVVLDGDPDQDGLITSDEIEIYGTDSLLADTDSDGLNDGEELDYWGADWNADIDGDGLINLLDIDSDGDGYSDGVEAMKLSDQADALSYPDAPTLETGSVTVSSDWQRVLFAEDFVNPVVVAKAVSSDDIESAVVRIRNVDAEGFEVRIQEWEYLDGVHGEVSVGFMVVERGSYTLPDGSRVEAGHFDTAAVATFDTLRFQQQFNVVPVISTSVITVNEGQAVTGRMREIDQDGFSFKMQEQELNEKVHAAETVSYIAWEPSSGSIDGLDYEIGRTGNSVTHNPVDVILTGSFAETPLFLAEMQTTDGGDTSLARSDHCLTDSCSVWIEEEQSNDLEVGHITEVVGYMVVGR